MKMDSVTFHYDSVLSDVHMLQPRTRHLMTRLNSAGQPVFLSKFMILSEDKTQDDRHKPEGSKEGSTEGCTEGSREESQELVLDEDGDFDFTHRPRKSPESDREELCPVLLSQASPQNLQDPPGDDHHLPSQHILRIEHTMATLLEDVGKQVWRGSLLLSDFLLSQRGALRGATVLELGAGLGLASVVAASVAKMVYCTDVGDDLLSMCKRNVTLNIHLTEPTGGEVKVRQLDWLQHDLCTDPEVDFSWSKEEVADLYDHTTFIIAADMVYDDDLTDAFFRTLYQLCSSFNHSCLIYLAIEKRLNFTLRHMDVCCEAYDHFLHCLQQLQELQGPPSFRAQRVAPIFPQSLMYERVEQLELWKVTTSSATPQSD